MTGPSPSYSKKSASGEIAGRAWTVTGGKTPRLNFPTAVSPPDLGGYDEPAMVQTLVPFPTSLISPWALCSKARGREALRLFIYQFGDAQRL